MQFAAIKDEISAPLDRWYSVDRKADALVYRYERVEEKERDQADIDQWSR